MDSERDPLTRSAWDQLAERYRDIFMDLDLYDGSYDAFCARLPLAGAQVLEVGCGPGNVTRALLNRRPDLRIHAIDYAPSMVALARTLVPAATFAVMDARAIGTLTERPDGILVGFCLPYLSPDETRQLIQDSARLLRPGGSIYLSTIEGDPAQSGYVSSSSGDARMYLYYHAEATLLQDLADAGFADVAVMRIAYARAGGAPSVHLVFLATLPQQSI
jgi:ubiquinone/menaquinone biosynthesis C-methylase UbiE